MPILTTAERLGTEIDGRYRVDAVLGQGGMGIVFAATHKLTQRRVAIKLLRPELAAHEPTADVRLVVEARATTKVLHPNVVQVLDMGRTEDGVPFMVMERLEGGTLKERLAEGGPLPAAMLLELLLPVLGAMAVAHDHGIVHRDLKPANVILSHDAAGRTVPKLLDFGVARLVEETGFTQPGAVLGTPHYLSPEQVEGESDIGPAADVWAMGVILYQCLSGRLPFEGSNVQGVLTRIVHGPAPALEAPGTPAALCSAVERALRREPRARYADMRELAHALLIAAHAGGIALPQDPDPIGLPHWRAWVAELQRDSQSTVESLVLRPAAAPANTQQQQAAPNATAHRPAWKLWLAVLVLVALATVVWLRRQSEPAAVESASTPSPQLQPQPTAPETTPPPTAAQASAPAQEVVTTQTQATMTAPPTPSTPMQAPHRARRRAPTAEGEQPAVAPTVAPPRTADRMIRAW